MSEHTDPTLPATEVAAFHDAVQVLTVRAHLDGLLLDTLTGSGMAISQVGRLVAFVRSGALEGGAAALGRLSAGVGEGVR